MSNYPSPESLVQESHSLRAIRLLVNAALDLAGLSLAAVKVWTRQKFKGTAALKKKINPTRVRIKKGKRALIG